MQIQWFPGHMTKALRMMEENIKLIDVVGYVLDARAPLACFNPAFNKLTQNKPCLFILNKVDLADPKKVQLWMNYFAKNNHVFVTVSATKLSDASKISAAFATLTKDINQKYKAKGIYKPVRAMIIGVPNSGKSTIINCLSGRRATVTGDRPGVTRGKQWIRLASGVELLDTPGTVWSKFEEQKVGQRLAFIGSIKDDIVDIDEVSLLLLEELKLQYPELLKSRYGLDNIDVEAAEIRNEICQKRGFLLSGGYFDTERAAKAIIDDFRKGKIGNITLDVPPC
jgi:ribosome biogenesis GTPase A